MKLMVTAFVVAGLAAGCENYDPCGDRLCGETCTVCDPDDENCTETAVEKVCNRNSVCVSAQPAVCG